MRITPLFLSIIFIGFFGVIGIWIFWPSQNPSVQATGLHVENNATTTTHAAVAIKNITLHEYEKKKGYELVVNAQKSLLLPGSDIIECHGVTGSIIRQGAHIACVCAEKSIINRTAREITFHGTIQGAFKDIVMCGADVVYNFATNKVSTDCIMTYTHPLFQLSAHQSRVDIPRQKIMLSGGVSSMFLYRTATNKGGN
jgi:hypothetical protein